MASNLISKKIADDVTVVVGTPWVSQPIEIGEKTLEGYFSLQFHLTGDGSAKVEYMLSNNGVDFLTPTGASDIVAVHTVSSGVSGKDLYSFAPMSCKMLKIKVTVTTDEAVINAWLGMR